MSTKKATACAGCEKRDATIKRQEQEATGLRGTAAYWRDEWNNVMDELSETNDALSETENARDNLESVRVSLQSRIDSFIATFADIRAVCVDAGIEHADKMATLTAVKALAERKSQVITERTMHIIPTPYEPTWFERVLPWIILALNIAILIRVIYW